MKKPKILVNLKTYQRKWRIDRPQISHFIEKIWQKIGKRKRDTAELTVVFLNNMQMQKYNRQFRKKDYATDVLSFPVNQKEAESFYLGDILISLEKTVSQASEKGHSPAKELQILLLHGILHLLGYDHETDQGEMKRLESRLRNRLISDRSTQLIRAAR